MNKPLRIALDVAFALFLALVSGTLAWATPQHDETTSKPTSLLKLVITKGHFEPDTLVIPANKRVKIEVQNTMAMPAEFESHDITVEKVIPGGTTLPVWVGPLKPGHYGFFNDFAEGVTGKIVARQAQGNR